MFNKTWQFLEGTAGLKKTLNGLSAQCILYVYNRHWRGADVGDVRARASCRETKETGMGLPTIRIDLDSTVAVYRQIEDALRALIVEGRLKPGERLPTVRQLAIDLVVHHNTVAEAYRRLAAEGWLDLGRRRGATVTAREGPPPTPETRDNFVQRLRELVAKAEGDGLKRKEIATIMEELAVKERGAE